MRIGTPNPTCLTSVHEIPEFLQGLSPRPELVCSLFPSVSSTHFLCSVRHLTHSSPRVTLVSLLIPSCLSSGFLPVPSILFSLYLTLSPVFDPYTLPPHLCSLFSRQPSCFLLIFSPCSQSVPLRVRKFLLRFFSRFVEQYQRPHGWQWRFVTGFSGVRFSSLVLFPV